MSESKAKLIEISETIRDHLIKQNAQAYENGDCLYKTPSGKMCAVGCLIKPEHYLEKFEGKGIDELAVQSAVEESVGFKFDRDGFNMLSNWQNYHDGEYAYYTSGESYWGRFARSPAKFHEILIASSDLNVAI